MRCILVGFIVAAAACGGGKSEPDGGPGDGGGARPDGPVSGELEINVLDPSIPRAEAQRTYETGSEFLRVTGTVSGVGVTVRVNEQGDPLPVVNGSWVYEVQLDPACTEQALPGTLYRFVAKDASGATAEKRILVVYDGCAPTITWDTTTVLDESDFHVGYTSEDYVPCLLQRSVGAPTVTLGNEGAPPTVKKYQSNTAPTGNNATASGPLHAADPCGNIAVNPPPGGRTPAGPNPLKLAWMLSDNLTGDLSLKVRARPVGDSEDAVVPLSHTTAENPLTPVRFEASLDSSLVPKLATTPGTWQIVLEATDRLGNVTTSPPRQFVLDLITGPAFVELNPTWYREPDGAKPWSRFTNNLELTGALGFNRFQGGKPLATYFYVIHNRTGFPITFKVTGTTMDVRQVATYAYRWLSIARDPLPLPPGCTSHYAFDLGEGNALCLPNGADLPRHTGSQDEDTTTARALSFSLRLRDKPRSPIGVDEGIESAGTIDAGMFTMPARKTGVVAVQIPPLGMSGSDIPSRAGGGRFVFSSVWRGDMFAWFASDGSGACSGCAPARMQFTAIVSHVFLASASQPVHLELAPGPNATLKDVVGSSASFELESNEDDPLTNYAGDF